MTLQYLPAQTRFVGDDWDGIMAFTITAYSVAPTQTMPGVPLNITGWTADGMLKAARPTNQGPRYLTGSIVDALNGVFKLALPKEKTDYIPQDANDTDPLLHLRARLIDPGGLVASVAVIPVFVFDT